MIRVDLTAWYWAGDELRECFIVAVAGVTSVIDAVTLAVVDVDVLDTLVERPDTPA